MKIRDFLDRPIAFHRAFVRLGVGVSGALMLSQAVYWSKRTRDEDGWFYKTQEEWQEETGLSRYEQETARKKLSSIKVLNELKKGVPAKLYYRVDFDELEIRLELSLGVDNPAHPSMRESHILDCGNPANKDDALQQTSLLEPSKLVRGIPANIHTEITTEITAEITDRDKPLSFPEKPGNDAVALILGHLNKVTGSRRKATSPSNANHILAILDAGYSVQDMIAVIDFKAREWMGTDKAQYLRPSTLFGAKFDGYLIATKPKPRPEPQEYTGPSRRALEMRQDALAYAANKMALETIKAAVESTKTGDRK